MREVIPLSVPVLNGSEWKYVKECLDSGWISSAGSFVGKFEAQVADYTGAKHAIAVVNGTAAIHLSLVLSGVKPGDCVLMPSLTFVATANAISYTGAEPIFIDANLDDWQMDSGLLQQYLEEECQTKGEATYRKKDGKRVAAIVPVHVQGNIGAIEKVIELADAYFIPVVEDSAEALGSFKKGKSAGRFGKLGCLSFNGNKIISTGGGGMIITDDDELAKKAKHLSTTAKTDSLTYFHDEVGYNYRLVNVLAAIGVAQMERLEAYVVKKQFIGDYYRQHLNGIGDISFQEIHKEVSFNNWLFTISTSKQTDLLTYLNEKEVMCRPFWMPMHLLPMYQTLEFYGSNRNSEIIHETSLAIPCSVDLTEQQLQRVVETIKAFFATETRYS